MIEPPKKTWELMGKCVSPPLGIAQLAAVLERENIDVDLVDCNASGLGWVGLERTIEESQPGIVGASAITPFFPQALRTMRIAKEVNPDIRTVNGGPHPTFDASETLMENPGIDIVARGEGERTIVDLVRCLDNGGD